MDNDSPSNSDNMVPTSPSIHSAEFSPNLSPLPDPKLLAAIGGATLGLAIGIIA